MHFDLRSKASTISEDFFSANVFTSIQVTRKFGKYFTKSVWSIEQDILRFFLKLEILQNHCSWRERLASLNTIVLTVIFAFWQHVLQSCNSKYECWNSCSWETPMLVKKEFKLIDGLIRVHSLQSCSCHTFPFEEPLITATNMI